MIPTSATNRTPWPNETTEKDSIWKMQFEHTVQCTSLYMIPLNRNFQLTTKKLTSRRLWHGSSKDWRFRTESESTRWSCGRTHQWGPKISPYLIRIWHLRLEDLPEQRRLRCVRWWSSWRVLSRSCCAETKRKFLPSRRSTAKWNGGRRKHWPECERNECRR